MIASISQLIFPRAVSEAASGLDVPHDNIDHNGPHIPVMLSEVLAAADIQKGVHVVDCTFGAGGIYQSIFGFGCAGHGI